MSGTNVSTGTSAFAFGILNFLNRVEYRRIERGEDFEAICRLRYRAYRSRDLVPANAVELVEDEFDYTSNCFCFGVYVDEKLISTIRLHRLTENTAQSPATAVYPDIILPRLANGEIFVEPSRFAVDPEYSAIYPQIPHVTQRIPWMGCFYFGAEYGISMIRDDHVAYYQRFYKSRQIGGPRNYGGVINCQALLYEVDILAIKKAIHTRLPFFKSSVVEQRLLFDRPSAGANAPLTVLPTANSLRAAA